MSLNVNAPGAHHLVQPISQATGEGCAKIEHQEGKASVQELLAIADRVAVHVKHPYANHAEFLYDENGSPK